MATLPVVRPLWHLGKSLDGPYLLNQCCAQLFKPFILILGCIGGYTYTYMCFD